MAYYQLNLLINMYISLKEEEHVKSLEKTVKK
jgi:hypothetical protein